MEVEANKIWWELSDIAGDVRDKEYESALAKLNDLMCQFDEDEYEEDEDKQEDEQEDD
jgi:hypothetical protein